MLIRVMCVLAFAALASTSAHAKFLEVDPIGYGDQMNLYAYCHNNPLNCTDPTGRDSWLVSRPVFGGGRHMFVVTGTKTLGDPSATRFSAGPETGVRDAALVPLTGTNSGTDRDDKAAWASIGSEDSTATFTHISSDSIPDSVMEAVGNAATGHPDYDLGVVPGGNDGANSNSYARAIVDNAASVAGVDPSSISNPAGWHPNVDQAGAVQFDQGGMDQAEGIMQGIVSEQMQSSMGCDGSGACPR